jgi:hypothetical protein
MIPGIRVVCGREKAYRRRVLFALEVLDGLTLEPVAAGLAVTAEGLRNPPIVNGSGIFVWLEEDGATRAEALSDPNRLPLKQITIDPRDHPYEQKRIDKGTVVANLNPGPVRVMLTPRSDYPFPSGVTILRGSLSQTRSQPGTPAIPMANTAVALFWKDANLRWRGPSLTARSARDGGFVIAVRHDADSIDPQDAEKPLVAYARFDSPDLGTRYSSAFNLALGRMTDASQWIKPGFAWPELTEAAPA